MTFEAYCESPIPHNVAPFVSLAWCDADPQLFEYGFGHAWRRDAWKTEGLRKCKKECAGKCVVAPRQRKAAVSAQYRAIELWKKCASTDARRLLERQVVETVCGMPNVVKRRGTDLYRKDIDRR